MRLIKLLFVILSITNITYSQNYPTIHTRRPRIYIDSTRFDYLHNNMSMGDCGNAYNAFNSAAFNNWYNDPQLYLLGSDSTLWTWDFSSK